MNEAEILEKLQEAFAIESQERLVTLGALLTELESAQTVDQRFGILEQVFRDAHSLKGAAASVGLSAIEMICQAMESVFSALKKRPQESIPRTLFDLLQKSIGLLENKIELTVDCVDEEVQTLVDQLSVYRLHEVTATSDGVESVAPRSAPQVDTIGTITTEATGRQPEIITQATQSATAENSDNFRQATQYGHLDEARNNAPSGGLIGETAVSRETTATANSATLQVDQPTRQTQPKGKTSNKSGQIQKVPAHKLTTLFQRSEAMISQKLVSERFSQILKVLNSDLEHWRRKWSEDKGSQAFVDWSVSFFVHLENELRVLSHQADQNHSQANRLVDDLMDAAREVIMLPCSTLLVTFPRLVREIAREQNKEVILNISGEDIELDRRILDEMKDPLTHMLRNAIDHGIENSAQRESQGKPYQGTINLSFSQVEGDKVEILLEDDGRGLDLEGLRNNAVEKGIISIDEAWEMSDHQISMLMFRSGISCAKSVTRISGRGLGMPIVLERVERLGGSIDVSGSAQQGTRMRIRLPISIITFQGLLVRVNESLFIAPSVQISGITRVLPEEVGRTGSLSTIPFGDEMPPLVNLGALLGVPPTARQERKQERFLTAMVARFGDIRIAFQVDEALGMLEVLVKSLGPQFKRLNGVSGAAVLGSGEVVPVLEVNDLIRRSMQSSINGQLAPTLDSKPERQKRLLIVEDSITSRTFLKNTLELEGYHVTTAVDGEEGLAVLSDGQFDLVVSDIEMPKIDGFEMVESIRAQQKFAELPIVLVTSLSSEEHQRRGLQVGANAYIVKSKFDQVELLQVIGHWI